MARAYRAAGVDSVEGFRQVLRNLIDEKDRGRFKADEERERRAAER